MAKNNNRITEVRTLVETVNNEVINWAKVNSLTDYANGLKLGKDDAECIKIILSTLPQPMMPHEHRLRMNNLDFMLWRFDILSKSCPSSRLKREMSCNKNLIFDLATYSQREKFKECYSRL